MTDTSTWATAVAAYGLGPPQGILTEGPVEDANWPRLLELARSQRLVGLLRAAAQDGVIALRGGQWGRLEQAYRSVAAQSAVAKEATVMMAETLHGSDIECRVLKGPALAYLDYPSADLRPFIDVNLLVKATEFTRAIEVLEGAGFTRSHAEPAPGFDARFRKGTSLVSASGMHVDLHRTIADGPYAMMVEHAELFKASSEIDVDGHRLFALGPEERLLHACFEARVGDTRPLLVRLRDIVQMVLTQDLDIGRIELLSGAWSAQSLVAEAVRRAWTLLGVTDMVPLSAWASAHQTSRRDQRRLLAYHRARSRTLVSVQTLRAIRPRRAVPGYMKAIALPDRAYLEGHYRGHMSRWWSVTSGRAALAPVRERLSDRAPDDELIELSWAHAVPYPA
jgi:hypothetical protein